LGSDRPCTCTLSQIARYRSKISGPLLDRIDLQVEVDNVGYDQLLDDHCEESSAQIKERVERARAIQRARFENDGIHTNANMGEAHIQKYCHLTPQCQKILREVFENLRLSVRARSRIIKVARTIADLEFSQDIEPKHILEAASYRTGGLE
jgi:magnesium chelatase family protein